MAPSTVLFSLVALAMPHAMAEVFSSKPWERTRHTYFETGEVDVHLACPAGFSLSCKPICCDAEGHHLQATCTDFGVNFTVAQTRECSSNYNTRSHECCACLASAPPIISLPQTISSLMLVTGDDCKIGGYSTQPSCQVANLTCPQGVVLSKTLMGCNSCPEGYATRAVVSSAYCSQWDEHYFTPSRVCQTCVAETVGTTTTTTPATRYGERDPTCTDGGYRDWEVVGVEGAGACRGNHGNDNNGSHYHVVSAYSIDECKRKCIQELPKCKGIEYSPGRCEIWTRPEGIFVTKNLLGFTCLRYGWPIQYLQPMDGGSDRACRGSSPTDNQDAYYRVQTTRYLEDCKARCAASRSRCSGIEFSLGRCERWFRRVGATANITGFQCFHYSDPRVAQFGQPQPPPPVTVDVPEILP